MSSLPEIPPSITSRWEAVAELDVVLRGGWSIETLLAASPFYGVNGIRVGPDGECWIAQHRAGTVASWRADTGAVTVRSPMGAPIVSPDDIVFDASGTIYVTEFGDSAVRGMRTDGAYVTVHDDLPSANGIAIDDSGRLFVSEFRADGRIVEVNRFSPGQARVIVSDAPWSNAFDRGPDGRLYYQNVRAGEIWSVDPDRGGPRLEFDGLRMPVAVKFDRRDRLIVGEGAVAQISALDLASGRRDVLATLPPGIDNFCFDAEDRLYVARNAANQVVRFAAGGDHIDAQTPEGLIGPQHLSVTHSGEVLVADFLVAFRWCPGSAPRPVWHLTLPDHGFTCIGMVELGDALVLLTTTGDLQWIDGGAASPRRLLGGAAAVAPYGGRIVVGTADGRLVELAAGGEVVAERASGLPHVSAVATYEAVVAACDDRTGTVVVLDGDTTRRWRLPGVEAVALGPDHVYLTDAERRSVLAVSRHGGEPAEIATGMPFGTPIAIDRGARRSSIVIAADGSLLVGCDGDGSVRRLRSKDRPSQVTMQ